MRDRSQHPGRAAYTRGSRAGYARFARFLRDGLADYGERRDNPLHAAGASRMSAYLHYGQVSPLRLARDLLATPASDSREKFLDEFLTWRELAHVYCTYEPGHETLAAVPEWAKRRCASRRAIAAPSCRRGALGARPDRRAAVGCRADLAACARRATQQPAHDLGQGGLGLDAECRDRAGAAHRSQPSLRARRPRSVVVWRHPVVLLASSIGRFHRAGHTWHCPSALAEGAGGQLDLPAYRRHVETPAYPQAAAGGGAGGRSGRSAGARTLQDQRFPVQLFDVPGGGEASAGLSQKMQPFCISDQRLRRTIDSWMQEGVISIRAAAEDPSALRYVEKGPVGTLLGHLERGLCTHRAASAGDAATHASRLVSGGAAATDLLSTPTELGPFDAVLAMDDVAAVRWLAQALAALPVPLPQPAAGKWAVYDRQVGLGCRSRDIAVTRGLAAASASLQPGAVRAAIRRRGVDRTSARAQRVFGGRAGPSAAAKSAGARGRRSGRR